MKMKAKVFERAKKTDQFYEEQKNLRLKMDQKIEREKSQLWQKYKTQKSEKGRICDNNESFKVWIQKHLSQEFIADLNCKSEFE